MSCCWTRVISFVQQSGLTGESDAVEKVCLAKSDEQKLDSLLETESLAFMGTNVISGRSYSSGAGGWR